MPVCVNHPHRHSTGKCPRCLRDFCADCLPTDHDLCERCTAEESLADAIAERRRLTPVNAARWMRSRRTIGTTIIFVLLLSVGLVPAILTARSTAEEGIDPTVVRRVQVGLSEQVDLGGEGFDLVEIVNNGQAQSSSPAADDTHVLDRVHDGLFDPNFPAWRSADADLPIVLTFQTNFRAPLIKAVIWNHPDEPAASYIRAFEIRTAVTDPAQNPDAYTVAGRYRLDTPQPVVRMELEKAVSTRWIEFRILETFGDAGYVSAAEIGLFAPPRDPQTVPVPRASGPVPI